MKNKDISVNSYLYSLLTLRWCLIAFTIFFLSFNKLIADERKIYNEQSVSNHLRLDTELRLKPESSSGPNYLSGEEIEGQIDDFIIVKKKCSTQKNGYESKSR